jgi:hypothetical protein
MASIAAGCAGLILIVVALQDAFEVVLLPRRIRRRLRLSSLFFRTTWAIWAPLGFLAKAGSRREHLLGIYGPLAMVCLFALWASFLIVGFGLIQWALVDDRDQTVTLSSSLFMSGDAFYTLGYGDIIPRTAAARLLIIVEAGTGFGLIAITLSYLPVLYQHFARRDAQLIQLAVRAGSPASGATLLLRYAAESGPSGLEAWLREWEIWAAEVLESHASYPMLSYYRSQHRDQSWLASLALMLDCCALVIAYGTDKPSLQACAAFATARRVLEEMNESLGLSSVSRPADRFPDRDRLAHLGLLMENAGMRWSQRPERDMTLADLRATYEGLLAGLSEYLRLPLPPWTVDEEHPQSRDQFVRRLLRLKDRR